MIAPLKWGRRVTEAPLLYAAAAPSEQPLWKGGSGDSPPEKSKPQSNRSPTPSREVALRRREAIPHLWGDESGVKAHAPFPPRSRLDP